MININNEKKYTHTLNTQFLPGEHVPAYAGCDIVTTFMFNGVPFETRNVTTLSIDSNCNITPIPTLGHKRINRFTRGHRYIAGTIAFLTTQHGPIPVIGPNTIFTSAGISNGTYTPSSDQTSSTITAPKMDALPPFDIIISYMDEYGRMSNERLYGVVIYKESKVIAISDIVTEIQCQYYALDRDGQIGSANTHIYSTGVNGTVAENVVMLNNIAILKSQKEYITNLLTQVEDGTVPDSLYVYVINNEDLGTVSKILLEEPDITVNKLQGYIDQFDRAIANYEQDQYYIDGLRQVMINSNRLPNI